MDASAAAPVLRLVGQVNDPRRHNRVHPLPQMIVMAVLAVMCGSDGWDDIAEFCEVRRPWLAKIFGLPRGVPCADTFARLNPAELEAVIQRWMQALEFSSAQNTINLDGKSARRSFEHAWDASGMAHLVGAYAGTGPSRTGCITCWTRASTRINRACARATARRTSRVCGG
jgi:hypothetical protein